MTASEYCPPTEWFASLPRYFAAAGALLTDPAGRLLLVKPSYKDGWLLPGGGVEPHETPHAACVREVKEELGIEVEAGPLVVVDWLPAQGLRPWSLVYFVFDCGVLHTDRTLRLHPHELTGYAFLPLDEAAARAERDTRPRLSAAITARVSGSTVYLSSR